MKSEAVLHDFVVYCHEHPQERFWQALRNWSKFSFIFGAMTHENESLVDTFYFENKDE